jgi:photosystem II stability/assembly factor-like uncharacterized protein
LLVVLVAEFVISRAFENEVGDGSIDTRPIESREPRHVHGLEIDPSDGDLLLAAHTGLFRASADAETVTRLSDEVRDLIAVTALGANRLLASGHGPEAAGRPNELGLLGSSDGGRSWDVLSPPGGLDLHALRSRGRIVYGFDAATDQLVESSDGGRTWVELRLPGPLIDFAIHPQRDAELVVATALGLFRSVNAGRSWHRIAGVRGLLAWPSQSKLLAVARSGRVLVSYDAGNAWQQVGLVPPRARAFVALGKRLYVAYDDGRIGVSHDGGASWRIRALA